MCLAVLNRPQHSIDRASNSETTDAPAICGGSPAPTTLPAQARLLPRWYLPGAASRVQQHRLPSNESNNENDNQYPCGLVHFRGVSVTDTMLSRQFVANRRFRSLTRTDCKLPHRDVDTVRLHSLKVDCPRPFIRELQMRRT